MYRVIDKFSINGCRYYKDDLIIQIKHFTVVYDIKDEDATIVKLYDHDYETLIRAGLIIEINIIE